MEEVGAVNRVRFFSMGSFRGPKGLFELGYLALLTIIIQGNVVVMWIHSTNITCVIDPG